MDIKDKFGRFKDAPWFNTSEEEENVIIGGAGGIGSWLALLLNRAGFVPIIYDFDKYEVHNIGGQLCKVSDIGKSKVESLNDTINLLCGNEVHINEEKYTPESMTHTFTFSAFDNMQARKDMFHKWLSVYKDDPDAIFIDGRLIFEQLQIYCVTPDKAKEYEKSLFNDAEVEEVMCTMKQTSHTAAMIASYMTAFFTNHITNIKAKEKLRYVPFFWEYFSPIGYNQIEE